MQPKEIFQLAMARKDVPRVPYIETSVAFGLSEKLLGRKLKPVMIPQLGWKMRTIEDEKELARKLGRHEIAVRMTAPTFSEQLVGADGHVFPGEGFITDMDKFAELFKLPDPEDDSLYEGLAQYIKGKEEFPVILSTRIAFLSAYMSIGFQNLMQAMYNNHELIDAVMSAYANWTATVIRRAVDMGIDGVQTTDDYAFNTAPFMSPEMFRKWVVAYHQVAIDEIQVPWILHTDGKIDLLMDDLLAMGPQALHPIDPNCYEIRDFKKQYGDRIVIIGNVNINTLGMETPEAVEEETKGLIRDLGPLGGWCISASNSVPDYVRAENFLAMTETIKRYGAYPINVD